jgi:hypothetical protein
LFTRLSRNLEWTKLEITFNWWVVCCTWKITDSSWGSRNYIFENNVSLFGISNIQCMCGIHNHCRFQCRYNYIRSRYTISINSRMIMIPKHQLRVEPGTTHGCKPSMGLWWGVSAKKTWGHNKVKSCKHSNQCWMCTNTSKDIHE